MTERTLADALAHAQILRQFLEQSPHRGGISEREIVLLADEVIRLREELRAYTKHGAWVLTEEGAAIKEKLEAGGSYGE